MAGAGFALARRNRGVSLVGADFVRQQLADVLPREVKSILRRSVATIAADMRKGMRKRAPKDGGTLRKAIISKRDRGTRNRVEASVWITHGKQAKHDAYYWHMVEFGTEHSKPKPFIAPVLAEFRADSRRFIEEQINKQVLKQLEARGRRQARAIANGTT